MQLFRPRIPTDVAVDFLTRQFGEQLAEFCARPELQQFVTLVRQHTDIAAHKEYRRLTGASMNECHLAVQVVRAATREEPPETPA
ncbi:hypothetical protein [Blastococcus atacamensis]|uniref:hypothetical protein n=1 Tax=Blastococcus atacamensis TaxID=2070508 RepID=UPI000CECB2F1|nr:hypothetical protein [Blastococcus atacamensis]